MPSVPPITAAEYSTLINWFLDHYTGLPLLVFGESGIGKTYIPEAIAQDRKIPYVHFNGTGLEPTDLTGMPNVSGDSTKFCPPHKLAYVRDPNSGVEVSLSQYPAGILTIDEVNRFEYQVINVVMQLLDRKTLETITIPKGWLVVLTANPNTEEYNVRDLNKAFLRRTLALEMRDDLQVWRSWAIKKKLDPKVVAVAGRLEAHRKASGVQFELKQYPTRAGLEQCSNLRQAGLESLPKDLYIKVYAGIIGPGAGAALAKSLSDEALDKAVKTLMVGGKIDGPTDFLLEASLMFMMQVRDQVEARAEEILNLYRQMPREIKMIIAREFINYIINATSGPLLDLGREWTQWQISTTTKS